MFMELIEVINWIVFLQIVTASTHVAYDIKVFQYYLFQVMKTGEYLAFQDNFTYLGTLDYIVL